MKYFTQELLDLVNSSDESVSDLAEAEWERRAEEFVGYIEQITTKLPKRLQDLLENYYFHDAIIRMAMIEDGRSSILVQREPPFNEVILLKYEQVTAATVTPQRDLHKQVEWAYDEFEVVEDGSVKHSILLNGGGEYQITFKEFDWEVVPDGKQCEEAAVSNV